MTETASSRPPTEKMLEYAKNIAKKLGIRVPDEVMVDGSACSKFIDANKNAALRPSDKQLTFAKAIAERKGVEIPDTALANGKELSKWIDENK
jgi:DNA topoisomerase-1